MFLSRICTFMVWGLSISLSISTYSAPSWVEGIRSGSESLRIIVGNKIFFRRIVGTSDISKSEACDQAVRKAKEDILNEFYLYEDVPYTVEILFYDEKHSDCATTLSVPEKIPEKYLKLNQWKKDQKEKEAELNSKIKEAEAEKLRLESKQKQLENYIQKNAYIINQVNKLEQTADSVEGMIRNRQNKAERFAITGIKKDEFTKFTGESVSIEINSFTKCYEYFESAYVSYHGNTFVCWQGGLYEGASIVGYCKRSTQSCYHKIP